MRVVLTICGMLALLGSLGGCPARGRGDEAPRRVLAQYARALEAGDLRRAYDLMTPEYKQRNTFAVFSRRIKRRPARVKRAIQSLTAADATLEIRAEAALDEMDALQLSYQDGKWWIATNPLDLYRQDTPRQALRSFIRAIEHRRYDMALRLAPSEWASRLTLDKVKQSWEGPNRAEMARLLAALKQNLNQPIQHESDNHATMPYGDRHAVRFVREEGLWKIADPD